MGDYPLGVATKDPMVLDSITPFIGKFLVPLEICIHVYPLELLVEVHELTGISPEFLQIQIFLKDQYGASAWGPTFLTNDQIVHGGRHSTLILGLS